MKERERHISQDLLKTLLRYNKRTGLFVWLVSIKSVKAGDAAGTFNGRYMAIKIRRRSYMQHRLAWLYVTGEWPENEIDHRDTDKCNNRWRNLREATRLQNMHNLRPMKNKKYSKLKGVTFAKGRRKWMANIREGRRYSTFIGYYDTEQAAHRAYKKRARALHGKFARTA